MGLLLSIVISYAGIHEAIECVKHILSGIIPNTQPDFRDLVAYYTRQLQKSANSSSRHWTDFGEGYLSLTEDDGQLKSAAVKFYNTQSSTAILFSTKISSFGQDSIEEPQANGDYGTERYTTRTKTLLTKSESTDIGRTKSPASYDNRSTTNSIKNETDDVAKEKLHWQYQPLSPAPLPEIHFQSYDDDKRGVYSEDFLRSLDGIKYKPLQRSDPSGRRRSFRKRHSSSSTSSKDSRASREEELKLFTSLEEAEFERMRDANAGGFGSTPNLSARSNSRSQSRERRSVEESVSKSFDSVAEEEATLKPRLKDVPKDSLEEETKETNEVIEEDDDIDFWANSGD